MRFPITAFGNDSIVRGFTLVELLVVVLIIGVLSAIAIPQYQKAVVKAQLAQVMTLYGAYHQAIDAYIMANGYPGSEDVFFTGNGNGGGSNQVWTSLDISYPVVNQSGGIDEIVVAGKHITMQAKINSTVANITISDLGNDKYLQGCGVSLATFPGDGWYLGGFYSRRSSLTTALSWSNSASECPEMKKLMCQYWKSNGTGLFRPTASSQCTAVGVSVP
ncbi:MAG: prepilin-type N-terminal cleavage/methylation domain-containing protein [Elusimicrobiaceae bacterium]|nr:prepilin-type N-terminal cleavage/methylation domain-containing protein [Elusimicrobiaceae bacterium]